MSVKRTKARRNEPSPPISPAGERRGVRWPLAVIVLAGVLSYAGSLAHPFIFDDVGSVVLNSSIQGFDLARALSPPPETPVGGRPLVNLSFALNHAWGGLVVQGYHMVNIALHVLCGLLVFGLIRRVVASVNAVSVAFVVALLWIVHPLNSEVVNYVTQRSESLMALFYLLTLYAAERATGESHRARWQATAIAACAAGMACKESMISAPLMVVFFDRVFRYGSLRECWRARARLYLGLFATWIVLAALVASSPRTSAAGFATTYVSSWSYLLSQSEMIARYLRLAVWPDGLVLYYGWATPTSLTDVWVYVVGIGALLLGSLWLLVKTPAIGVFAVWVFITLAPTSSFVPIASEVGAERRMYLPLVGLLALGVIGAASMWQRGRPLRPMSPGITAVVLMLATLLGAVTVARTREYSSPLTMAQTVLDRWPTPSAHYMVGTELVSAGRIFDAIPHLRAGAEQIPPARFNLGKALLDSGSPNEAIPALEAFVRDEPNLMSTRDARLLLARAYTERGQRARAFAVLEVILARDPSDAGAHGLLAEALKDEGRFAEAEPHYRAYLAANSRDAAGWTGLAIALVSTNRAAEAVEAFRQAVNADPRNPGYRMNLARTLIDQGRPAEALEHARAAVSMSPNDPAARELLRVAGGG